MTIACHICGKTVLEANGLTRVNPVGEPGIWACWNHRDRCGCAVAFCSKSIKGHHSWAWICADHWRMVPKRMKAPYFRIRRLAKGREHWTPEEAIRVDRLLRRMAGYVSRRILGEFIG